MKTVLITGVTGFIGRYVAREFSQQGWNVVGLGTRPPENAPVQNLERYEQISLPSPKLGNLIREIQPQICIHCAARASVPLSVTEPQMDFEDGVRVTFDLLNNLRLHSPECKTIYLSSAAVYGNPQSLPVDEKHPLNPISPYGYHKLICEQICREFYQIYQLPTATVRIFSAYGPGLRRQVMWDIAHKALTDSVICLQGTGTESRDFIHARDIAVAMVLLAEKSPCQADIYNLASGRETTIGELADLVVDSLGSQLQVNFNGIVPIGNPLHWKADDNYIKTLGFHTEVPLERGVKVYAQWCRAEVMGW
jgi:UDP-glucose 4-epimerase